MEAAQKSSTNSQPAGRIRLGRRQKAASNDPKTTPRPPSPHSTGSGVARFWALSHLEVTMEGDPFESPV